MNSIFWTVTILIGAMLGLAGAADYLSALF
jgi:hypothetical protein